MAHKGPGEAQDFDASQTSTLRIGILHSRWNAPVIDSLLKGCLKTIHASGVRPENIYIQSVPGSYELPFAAQRMYTASNVASSSSLVSAATDLLGSVTGSTSDSMASNQSGAAKGAAVTGPLDAIIAIGVLIKGSTMHFEYISDAVSHGLMRVQLDTGCPVIFGVLTCLTEEQAHTRAGLVEGGAKEGVSHGESGHNHGEDWGAAAVEMGLKRRGWGEGRFL